MGRSGGEKDLPVVAGGDEAGALLVAGIMLGALYDKLESVFHVWMGREGDVGGKICGF